jgi:DNA repair protein RecO (recombination protein O)
MTLHATRGIVFHTLKYAETSIIAKVFTEKFGLRSYLVKGVRSAGSKTRTALFQPMSLLDLVVYEKEKNSLNSIREVRLAVPFASIPFDIRKSSVLLFICELSHRAIREEEPNPALFRFLWEQCLALEARNEGIADFHLFFTLELMHHLGIYPQNNHSQGTPVFNLREGMFQFDIPDHPDHLDPAESLALSDILKYCTPHPAASPYFPASGSRRPVSRFFLLETLLRYYRLHLPGFGEMKSPGVLREVLG